MPRRLLSVAVMTGLMLFTPVSFSQAQEDRSADEILLPLVPLDEVADTTAITEELEGAEPTNLEPDVFFGRCYLIAEGERREVEATRTKMPPGTAGIQGDAYYYQISPPARGSYKVWAGSAADTGVRILVREGGVDIYDRGRWGGFKDRVRTRGGSIEAYLGAYKTRFSRPFVQKRIRVNATYKDQGNGYCEYSVVVGIEDSGNDGDFNDAYVAISVLTLMR